MGIVHRVDEYAPRGCVRSFRTYEFCRLCVIGASTQLPDATSGIVNTHTHVNCVSF